MEKNEEIKVSVLCAVYNHEKYLKDCLDSLVNQKTNFEYEILINDDCSTDNSQKIIEDYYRKYPKKIVPIYQKENQYSQGVRINIDILIPRMRGKYFCFCEGDDYWIDENKLQKQYDFMENNPEYSLCVHNAIIVDKDKNKLREIVPIIDGGDLTCEEFIKGDGGFVATNSIFSRSVYAKNLPKYFDYMTLDYIWQIYLSSCGKSYCFKDFMSAYRLESEGSWSSRVKDDISILIELKKKIIKSLNLINEETNYIYDNAIKEAIIKHEYGILSAERNYKEMKKKPYRKIWKSKPLKQRVKYFLDEHFPIFYRNLMEKRSKRG